LNEKIDNIRECAGRTLQKFFKFTLPNVTAEFSMRDEFTALFIANDESDNQNTVGKDGISYLPWRQAKFVFESIKPFFDSDVYSHSILKGLITSSGGLTESTLKAS
jgi:hypothetical protein